MCEITMMYKKINGPMIDVMEGNYFQTDDEGYICNHFGKYHCLSSCWNFLQMLTMLWMIMICILSTRRWMMNNNWQFNSTSTYNLKTSHYKKNILITFLITLNSGFRKEDELTETHGLIHEEYLDIWELQLIIPFREKWHF